MMQFDFGFECLASEENSSSEPTSVQVDEINTAPAEVVDICIEKVKIQVGDIVVYTYLTGRPCPQLGYVCVREESKVAEPTAGYISERDKTAKIKIAPLTRLASGSWVKSSNKRNIVTRVEGECFRIPNHLADLKITL